MVHFSRYKLLLQKLSGLLLTQVTTDTSLQRTWCAERRERVPVVQSAERWATGDQVIREDPRPVRSSCVRGRGTETSATKFLCLCAMCGVEYTGNMCFSSLRHATSPHEHVAHSHLLVCTLHTGHGSRTRRQTSTGGARGSTSRRHRLKARAAWSRWCPAQSHVESVSTLPSAPLTSAR